MNEEKDMGFCGACIAAWKFFDGKKTIIGGILLGLSGFLQGLFEIIRTIEDPWNLSVALLAYTGGWLTTGGLVHKKVKGASNGQAGKDSNPQP